jgi:hypothetical protein
MQKRGQRPRYRHAAFLFCLAAGSQGIAQEAGKPEHYIHNTTVFVEAWGEGVFNSLNIEKTMPISGMVDIHMRLGFGYWRPEADFYAVPVDVGVSYGGLARLEFSVGATPYALSAHHGDMASGALAPTIGFHLRIQQPHGGVFFRAGAIVAPLGSLDDIPGNEDLVKKGTWEWNPGVALGFTF